MIRRIWVILLSGLLLCTGCGLVIREETPEGTPYELYFLAQNLESVAGDGALQAETTYLKEGADIRQTAQFLMDELLKGPQSEELKSPIPLGTMVESLEIRGSQAVVDMSPAYGNLSNVRLTLADYAITMTLTQIPEIMSVRVTVQGKELGYRDRQVFTPRDVLLAPQGDVVSTVKARLYFLDENGNLIAEERVLDLYEGDTQVSAVARGLEKGPEGKNMESIFPAEFRIKSVWQEEGICYVNLSSALLINIPEGTDLSVVIRSLGNSLCSLDSVSETRFLVDGKFVRNYGSVNVERPYTD